MIARDLPKGVFRKKTRYEVCLRVAGKPKYFGSYSTLEEAHAKSLEEQAKIAPKSAPAPKPASKPAPAPAPAPTDQIKWDQKTKKTLLMLKIRNEIASKEAYVAYANMETAGVEWSYPWDNGWKKCGKNVRSLVTELEKMLEEGMQNGEK